MPFSESVKNWKSKFFKVRATSPKVRDQVFYHPSTGRPRFPLFWSWPRKCVSFDAELTPEEGESIQVLLRVARPLDTRRIFGALGGRDPGALLDGEYFESGCCVGLCLCLTWFFLCRYNVVQEF